MFSISLSFLVCFLFGSEPTSHLRGPVPPGATGWEARGWPGDETGEGPRQRGKEAWAGAHARWLLFLHYTDILERFLCGRLFVLRAVCVSSNVTLTTAPGGRIIPFLHARKPAQGVTTGPAQMELPGPRAGAFESSGPRHQPALHRGLICGS